MSAAAITFEPWYIDYYKTMAATASAGSAISRGTSVLSLAKNSWVVARHLRGLVSKLEAITELPDDREFDLFSLLLDLHRNIERLLDMASKKGLTNRTLTAGSFYSIRVNNGELLEFVERSRLSRDPAVGRALSQATEEYERGETVSIDTLI